MNKKKVDSILKGITAAGIAMGGVSSIQGADMVMAAINESAADSNSLVDAGSLSESERTEYSESTTQSMSERAHTADILTIHQMSWHGSRASTIICCMMIFQDKQINVAGHTVRCEQ